MADEIKKAKNIEQVTIFGSAHADSESALVKEAFEVCKQLAEVGYIIVDGGGPGVMRAATMGAKAGGGQVIGIVLQPDENMHYEGRDQENKFDIEIKAKNYVERTIALMREGQVYVVFNGGTGTISEFGMAWGLAKLYFGNHKPLILYGDFWKPIMDSFKNNMLVRPEEYEVFTIVSSPKDALEAIEKYEGVLTKNRHEHINCNSSECYLLL